MKKDRKKILELLQLKGCLEVHEEVKEDKVFEKSEHGNPDFTLRETGGVNGQCIRNS